jgi:hypothetical protein
MQNHPTTYTLYECALNLKQNALHQEGTINSGMYQDYTDTLAQIIALQIVWKPLTCARLVRVHYIA